MPLSAWARPGRCRARTPAGEVYAEGMKARVATAVGFVARLRCVEAGARRGGLAPPTRVRVWAAGTVMLVSRVMGRDRVGGP